MAESFLNIRLSQKVLVGVTGGPGFKTSMSTTKSGDEYRNIDWSQERGKWNTAYTDDHERISEIAAFFRVTHGSGYGFRFKDWADFEVDNVFALGDGTTTEFQAAKVYSITNGSETFNYVRRLSRLVEPVVIKVDGVVESPAVNVNTGKINFSLAPADQAKISIQCQFDVPVRFDTDELPMVMISRNLSALESVPIIEIRDRSES